MFMVAVVRDFGEIAWIIFLGLAGAIGVALAAFIGYWFFVVMSYGYFVTRVYLFTGRVDQLGWKERLAWLFFFGFTFYFFFFPMIYSATDAIMSFGDEQMKVDILLILILMGLIVLLLSACDLIARKRWSWRQKRPTAAERLRERDWSAPQKE
jgi:hypothetical protein